LFHRRQTGITPAVGPATVNVYDANNQLISSTVGTQTTTYIFDDNGNEISRTEPGTRTTTTNYNELGQATSVVDPDNKTTSYAYDIRGNQIVQAEENISSYYTYDRLGREIKMVDSKGRIKKKTMDDKGNVTKLTDIFGGVLSNYDANNHLFELKVPLSVDRTSPNARIFKYSNNVRLLEIWSAARK
jgi:YD repeat-containing protein